jgi:hypothetical protein
MSRQSKKPRPDRLVHPAATVNGYRYKFVDKHHHPPKGDHACWLRSISPVEEFTLFNEADRLGLSDEDGNLYNVRKEDQEYLEVGTRHELVAIFWNPHSVSEWHGHPLWPIKTRGPFNRKTQKYRPPKLVMNQMVRQMVLSERDSYRILNGDHP